MSMDPAIQKRATRFVLLTVLIYSMGFGIIMPVLPDLIRHLADVDAAEAARIGAWIGATYGLFQVLLMPTVGNLGDRFGRRPVFLVSLFAFGLDFLLMGLAPNIGWLFVGRAIAGGLGAIFGPANAAMADMSTADNRAASFGKVGAAFGMGFILGPVVGGFLGDFGPRVPFFVAAGLAFANGIYGWLVFPETMAKEKQRPFEWKRANPLGAFASLGHIKGILPVALIYFLWALAGNVYPSSWSFFAPIQYDWDSRMVGISLGLVGVSMALFQAVIIRRFITRFGERRTAYVGMLSGIASYLVVAFVPYGGVIMVLLLVNGFSGMVMPSLNAMMSMRTPPSQQGELQGLIGSLSALSLMIAQFTYNYALAAFTETGAPVRFPGAPFVIAATIGAIAFLSLLMLRKRPDQLPQAHD
ncbi:MFS transporter [Sphingorhabdus pulchriflava]|uniref:MFS transporter n=1 Tax=Sphingorhabdus pulchriflava TaxID=2292257 RepID=A0A371BHI8_9SPHN|nr:TCR/Tet family MFS transporter [Sphingorhabdus pulchriflava]RDV07055.1 MFS transporter [Sphingorhabdus pulchriflava]